MNEKKLVLILDAQLPYVRKADLPGTVEESWFFHALTFTYLPLLRSFTALETEGVPFYAAVAFSPQLTEMLADPLLQIRYTEHLDASIRYAEQILSGGLPGVPGETWKKAAAIHLDLLQKNRRDFTEIYEKNILKKFDYFSERGYLELMATAATPCFFPFYKDIPEVVNAQIETGLMAHRMHFASIPDGFWLPALGWFPGVEKSLKAYGFRYSAVENIAFLFSESPPPAGVFAPAVCGNGFYLFPRDSFASTELYGEPGGRCFHPAYLDVNRDIGFELDGKTLEPLFDLTLGRRVTGFRCMARGVPEKSGASSRVLYDPDAAARQVEADAAAFLDAGSGMLSKASSFLEGEPVCRTCAFPASLFGCSWYEGVAWLESVFRQAAARDDISFARPSFFLSKRGTEKPKNPPPVSPVFSSWFENGYADELLNGANDWIYPYLRKASERMVDLAERFPGDGGLKERVLNTAARALFLAQSLDWPLMMNDPVNAEYARSSFEENIRAFTTVYESLGSNFVSTEWLTEMERKQRLFPFMNYRVFSRRK